MILPILLCIFYYKSVLEIISQIYMVKNRINKQISKEYIYLTTYSVYDNNFEMNDKKTIVLLYTERRHQY
jgi:hypothetical protein